MEVQEENKEVQEEGALYVCEIYKKAQEFTMFTLTMNMRQ